MSLTPEEISEMRTLASSLETLYGPYKTLCKRYEEIYFMDNKERPRGLSSVDNNDVKITISPAGRNNVTGLKRILDTGEIQIKVHSEDESKADKIEKGLHKMMKASNERRLARVEKDENLSSVLYGMSVLTVESVDDLIAARTKKADGSDKEGVNKFVVRQLEELKKQSPFIIEAANPMQSYPEWGRYGQTGHLRIYDVRGNVLKETWGVTDGVKDDQKYTVRDYFHYDKRLVWADGVKGELFADTWIDIASEDVPQIPVFVSYGGGSSLWYEPERQLHPFLYAIAQGEWDKRENLFWTYLFTAIYMQGLPGPTLIKDPDDTSPVKIDYDQGVKIITAKGTLQNISIIDNDVMQIKRLMDETNAGSTIRAEAFGAGADNATFSGYVTSMNASKLPSEDPKEGIAKVYKDAFCYILKRIKAESIDNDLIAPTDIPDDVEIEVTLEPNMTQDDLRNAQILTSLKNANTNLSNEWLNTNILKIADSEEMYKQKTKEDFRQAMIGMILQNKELMQPIIMQAMGQQQGQTPPQPSPNGSPQFGEGGTPPMSPGQMPPEMQGQQMPPELQAMMAQQGGLDTATPTRPPMSPEQMMAMQQSQQAGEGAGGMMGSMGENLPQTDAMIPQNARKAKR